MNEAPEMPAIELALIEAIVLLDLALLGADTVAMDVGPLNSQAIGLIMRDMSAPPPEREVTELITVTMRHCYTIGDTLGRLRPVIVQFVEAQKQLLRERSNAEALH